MTRQRNKYPTAVFPFPHARSPRNRALAVMATNNKSDELSPDYKEADATELASAMDQDELELVSCR